MVHDLQGRRFTIVESLFLHSFNGNLSHFIQFVSTFEHDAESPLSQCFISFHQSPLLGGNPLNFRTIFHSKYWLGVTTIFLKPPALSSITLLLMR